MPKIRKRAGPSPWSAKDTRFLEMRFATTSNAELAEKLDRSVRSVIRKAADKGLKKSTAHISAMNRKTALAHLPSVEDLRKIGRLGGLKGGLARAATLTERQRKLQARKAIRARWRKKKR